MPVFEWNNDGRFGKLIAFANVEVGLSKTASSSYMRLEAERKRREASERREATLTAETGKLKSRAEDAEKVLADTRKQLQNFKRQRFRLESPDPEQDRVETFKTLLSPLPEGRLLDLGCGHGKFSLAAASLGWKVTAVDARTERMPTSADQNIEWLQGDVREFSFDKDDFDCISVLGLLYHLEQPAQMDLLKRCAGTLTILDTRVGLNQGATENGYRGEYYKEPGETEEERKTRLAASWGNAQSFWPTEDSLIKMARDAGFSLVAPVRPPRRKYRTFYVCYP
ncbi:class I SAM-dependent methyltransferase [Rubrobacter aplysinae]|uniref:class I SAM-dependent methyltransferase n=1 Tax=Rubrobacter aplysinae TaxID=909625 RepID=UPI00064C09B4|nr:class I SAM-dependent methyltransferase [Rubrobacter aplysinae]